MHAFWKTLQFSLRQLRRSPAFSLIAVATLALSIGVTAAVYGIVREVLLAPLPYAQPDQLVALSFQFPGEKPSTDQIGTAADFIRRNSRSFSGFGVAGGGTSGVNFAQPGTAGHAVPLQQLRISHDFFNTLRIRPLLGRSFTPEEDTPGGPAAAILSYDLWTTQFAADPNILGRLVRIDGADIPVVGVLPRGALGDLRGDSEESPAAAVWQPLQLNPKQAGYEGTNYQMFARLRDGVTQRQAADELEALLPQFAHENSWYSRWRLPDGTTNHLRVSPLHAALVGDVHDSLLMMLGAVGMVLLVGCLNLAGLMVSRTLARSRELAVRSALGASRSQLYRLIFGESLLLSVAGALLAVVVAKLTASALLAFAPISLPNFHAGISLVPLASAAFLLALLGTILFGLLPALVVLHRPLNAHLTAARVQGSSRAASRSGKVLIVTQVALACLLLSVASLLLSTFLRLRSTSPGIRTENITVGQVTLKDTRYNTTLHTTQFIDRVVAQMLEQPGVHAAGAVNGLPLDHGLNDSGWPAGREDLRGMVQIRFVTPGYMQAIGIPLLGGRGITAQDRADTPFVAVISQYAARHWWPNASPLGQRIDVSHETSYEVVGIAADTHERSLLDSPSILLYVPLTQVTDHYMAMINNWFPVTFVIGTANGVDVSAALQRAVTGADPGLPLSHLSSMQAIVDRSVAAPRFFSWLSASFAGFALLLAALGIFGLLSYQVGQRTQEIGVRMALGATRGGILGNILRSGLTLAGVGLACGTVVALGLPRLVQNLLSTFIRTDHGVSLHVADEAASAAAAILLLLLATAIASLIPARRAASVEPAEALRQD